VPSLIRRARNVVARPPDPFLKSTRIEEQTAEFLRGFDSNVAIVNIGAGSTRIHPRAINLDIRPTEESNVVGSALALPFRNGVIDVVVSQGLLEHVVHADQAVAEMCRVLKVGGFVYAEIPFLQPFHESPSDYMRVTHVGIEELFRRNGFEVVRKGVQIGPGSTLAWVSRDVLAAVFGGHSPWRYQKARTLAGWLVAPLRYLDRLLDGSPYADCVASAFFYYGRKSEA
jgi:SAM-dependent methyltransferase